MMRTIVMAVLLVLGLSACGDGGTGPESSAGVGTYDLQTVQGSPLPATVFTGPEGRIQVTAGIMDLRPDRTYTETITLRLTPPTGAPETASQAETGTYVVNANAITFTITGGESRGLSYSGSVRGRDLSYNFENVVVTYRRR